MSALTAHESPASGAELHSKFVQAGNSFTMNYSALSTFFGGLEAKIGPPNPKVRAAMVSEHTAAADSQDEFTTGNYCVTTTPQLEWWFVTEPERDGVLWPLEKGLRGSEEKMRQPLPLNELRARLEVENAKLRKLGESPLIEEEAFGARL